jgi:ABC-type protease/lipase transport system fused ATPase/permease subunit
VKIFRDQPAYALSGSAMTIFCIFIMACMARSDFFLTIFPPLLVMTVVDKVLTHHSYSTLVLLGTILAIATIYEAVLGYARRLIVMVVGARLDAKLNLHVFNWRSFCPSYGKSDYGRNDGGKTSRARAQVSCVAGQLSTR